jgi:4-amino-4-deoxy-L-arabinose transferase-like glycosyltransferase
MAALAVVLTAFSAGYGFERDELYFRMLPPRWGYVDTPALTPLLARLATHVSSSPWAMRVPATVFAVLSVLVVVLITREFGGGGGAQALCAWTYAFAATPLLMGHVLLTSSLDLVVWPAVCLCVIRALLRDDPRWWPAAGAVVGLSAYNKLLISLLVAALVLGLVISGPRHMLASRWVGIAVVVALVVALPNLLYQATHSWPQLTMSRALSRDNATSVRVLMWPYLALLLGPPLVPVWISGLVALRRRPSWRAVRFLATAFVVLLLETCSGGGQLYYPVGLLAVMFAVGCVPTAEYLAGSVRWRRTAWVAFCVNGVVSSVIALPVVPLSLLHETPVPAINQLARDQVGWPDYVAQTAAVYATIPAAETPHAVIITSNYGEAGAITGLGAAFSLPQPYSGHNQLYFDRRPPQDTTIAVIVGSQLPRVSKYFAECVVVARLHNRYGVDNEEQNKPVAICRNPVEGWATLWPVFMHYD